MKPWINIDKNSDFSIHNIPFGIYSVGGGQKKIGVAIGSYVLNLPAAAKLGIFEDIKLDHSVLDSDFLNDFIGQGKEVTSKVRATIQKHLCMEDSPLRAHPNVLVPREKVDMHLPVKVGDYTDFYSSIEHATNVGKLFRDPENALLPNWRHLPVGYHGRASSIIVSGTDFHRPKGQLKPADGPPVFGPCRLLDFELEMAFVVGKSTNLGQSISTSEAPDYIFGMALFNDWSARDIQKWEYVPLGPFLGKSFASSISPWIVTMEALEPFRVPGPEQSPKVLPYLQYEGDRNIDIALEVSLLPKGGQEDIISRSNYKYMYWNQEQQLAHHTVNGCNVNVGDVMASGTISGKDEKSYGSLLEITRAGRRALTLSDGQERKFIQDYDTIIMRGHCTRGEIRVGFGEVRGMVLPAK